MNNTYCLLTYDGRHGRRAFITQTDNIETGIARMHLLGEDPHQHTSQLFTAGHIGDQYVSRPLTREEYHAARPVGGFTFTSPKIKWEGYCVSEPAPVPRLRLA